MQSRKSILKSPALAKEEDCSADQTQLFLAQLGELELTNLEGITYENQNNSHLHTPPRNRKNESIEKIEFSPVLFASPTSSVSSDEHRPHSKLRRTSRKRIANLVEKTNECSPSKKKRKMVEAEVFDLHTKRKFSNHSFDLMNQRHQENQKKLAVSESANFQFSGIPFTEAKRVVVFDLETTGFSSNDSIIEIAAVEIVDKKVSGVRFHTYVCPSAEFSIHPCAQKVHGIEESFLKKSLSSSSSGNLLNLLPLIQPTEVALTNFLQFVADSPLIAHQAGFDYKFLKQELSNNNLSLSYPPESKIFCTMQFFKKWYGNTQSADLNSVSHYYGIDFLSSKFGRNNFHGAMPDALLCAQIYLNELDVYSSMKQKQQQQQQSSVLPKPIGIPNLISKDKSSIPKKPIMKPTSKIEKVIPKPLLKPILISNTTKVSPSALIKDENLVPNSSSSTTTPVLVTKVASHEKSSSETKTAAKVMSTNPFDPKDPIYIASKFTVEQKHNFVMFMNHASVEELQKRFQLSKPIAADIEHMKTFVSFDQLMEKFNTKPYLGYRLSVDLCQRFFKKS